MTPTSTSSTSTGSLSKTLLTHLIAGGCAGLVESCVCHPLDTLKVRMQLSMTSRIPSNLSGVYSSSISSSPLVSSSVSSSASVSPPSSVRRIGPIRTAITIFKSEGPAAFYKGFGAVVSAIVPKMAIRFWSFELYKTALKDPSTGRVSTAATFVAGLGAGVTEAVLVVNPMEVVKIRLQAQRTIASNPNLVPSMKYKNAPQAAYTIIKDEGIGSLYRGVSLTAARQATNQAVNFTLYQKMKLWLMHWEGINELPSWQHFLVGGLSGAIAPICNAPIDTIKTRIQRQGRVPGQSGMSAIRQTTMNIILKEGYLAFYNGLTPRLLRIAPGQAITFMVYEKAHPIVTSLFKKYSRSIEESLPRENNLTK